MSSSSTSWSCQNSNLAQLCSWLAQQAWLAPLPQAWLSTLQGTSSWTQEPLVSCWNTAKLSLQYSITFSPIHITQQEECLSKVFSLGSQQGPHSGPFIHLLIDALLLPPYMAQYSCQKSSLHLNPNPNAQAKL